MPAVEFPLWLQLMAERWFGFDAEYSGPVDGARVRLEQHGRKTIARVGGTDGRVVRGEANIESYFAGLAGALGHLER